MITGHVPGGPVPQSNEKQDTTYYKRCDAGMVCRGKIDYQLGKSMLSGLNKL